VKRLLFRLLILFGIIAFGVGVFVAYKIVVEGRSSTSSIPECAPGVICKPAIYLYPENNSVVRVKVIVNGEIIKSLPEYKNGWNIYASSSGLINGEYEYLFYEVQLNNLQLPSEGWVVKYDALPEWFDTNLERLGLNEKEKSQFENYWLKNLPKSEYYEIKLLSSEFLKKNMDLVINPQPDTVIRLEFSFKPLNKLEYLIEPNITTPVRKGFTVVEWGGLLDK